MAVLIQAVPQLCLCWVKGITSLSDSKRSPVTDEFKFLQVLAFHKVNILFYFLYLKIISK